VCAAEYLLGPDIFLRRPVLCRMKVKLVFFSRGRDGLVGAGRTDGWGLDEAISKTHSASPKDLFATKRFRDILFSATFAVTLFVFRDFCMALTGQHQELDAGLPTGVDSGVGLARSPKKRRSAEDEDIGGGFVNLAPRTEKQAKVRRQE
jgi:hypothetical protein